MVYRRWMSVCSPVQTISNDRHDHHHCHIEFAPVMVVTVVMVTAYCYGRGMHTCPGKTGPSWPKANTGGASAALRHRQGANRGLQGLRFAPRHHSVRITQPAHGLNVGGFSHFNAAATLAARDGAFLLSPVRAAGLLCDEQTSADHR